VSSPSKTLADARLEFVTQWGVLGSAWGINRTMAMLHALLLTSPVPLSTDDTMEALKVSRGNANTNLRELVSWGLLRKVVHPGERRDYFEAEKDVWKIFCTVVRERKRREVDPALAVLRACAEQTAGLEGSEAREFHGVMKAIGEFVELAARIMDRVASSERSKILPAVLKLFK
jgi:DNA-binding transcriptional regulator GbsR (MarR family)